MSKYECVCELCEHKHRWWIGYAKCVFDHFLEASVFGPDVNAKGIRIKRRIRELEQELERRNATASAHLP